MAKKILVVDDDPGIVDALSLVLGTAGYEVETSLTGDFVDGLTPSTLPDLILLDVRLSGTDGRELCRSLKADPDTKDVPILMVSADHNVEHEIHLCGANGFIAKPFEIKDLLSNVADTLTPHTS